MAALTAQGRDSPLLLQSREKITSDTQGELWDVSASRDPEGETERDEVVCDQGSSVSYFGDCIEGTATLGSDILDCSALSLQSH